MNIVFIKIKHITKQMTEAWVLKGRYFELKAHKNIIDVFYQIM